MCNQVYIGSVEHLASTQSDAFSVKPLDSKGKTTVDVRKHFSLKHLYFLGAHTGCGCGFSYLANYEGRAPQSLTKGEKEGYETEQKNKKSFEALGKFLEESLNKSTNLEIFLSSLGSEHMPISLKESISLKEFLDDHISLFTKGHNKNLMVTLRKDT